MLDDRRCGPPISPFVKSLRYCFWRFQRHEYSLFCDSLCSSQMFAANEKLYGQKIEYSGNPHEFADNGFDPHKFHIVGGGFMNAPSGGGGSGGDGDGGGKKKAQRKAKDVKVVDEDGFVSFFDADGDAPWEGDVKGSQGGRQRETEPAKPAAPTPPAVKPAQKTKEAPKDKMKRQKEKPKPAPVPTTILANPTPKSDMSSTLMNMIGMTAPKSSTPIEEAAPFVPASERHGADFFGAATFTFNSGKVLGAGEEWQRAKRRVNTARLLDINA